MTERISLGEWQPAYKGVRLFSTEWDSLKTDPGHHKVEDNRSPQEIADWYTNHSIFENKFYAFNLFYQVQETPSGKMDRRHLKTTYYIDGEVFNVQQAKANLEELDKKNRIGHQLCNFSEESMNLRSLRYLLDEAWYKREVKPDELFVKDRNGGWHEFKKGVDEIIYSYKHDQDQLERIEKQREERYSTAGI
jgi:hypothetical protein